MRTPEAAGDPHFQVGCVCVWGGQRNWQRLQTDYREVARQRVLGAGGAWLCPWPLGSLSLFCFASAMRLKC